MSKQAGPMEARVRAESDGVAERVSELVERFPDYVEGWMVVVFWRGIVGRGATLASAIVAALEAAS